MTTQTPPIESGRITVFRAGTRLASDGRLVSVTRADLQDIVDSYDPHLQRAPHVIGHPELDAPAWGWIKSLTVEGDALLAESEQVDAEFAEMVNSGRFPNRSTSIYLPTTPGNPKPGHYYIKHVGWLGAAPPAVSGLPAARFAADSDAALSFSFPAQHMKKETRMTEEEIKAAQAALEARENALKEGEQRIAHEQAEISKRAAQAAREDAVQFAQQLEKDGRLLPAEVQPVVELLLAQPKDEAPLSFSQAGTQVSKPAGAFLRELLKAMPSRIDYREKSGDQTADAAVAFSAPPGAHVDTAQADLYARARQVQAKHPGMAWLEAVKAAGGR